MRCAALLLCIGLLLTCAVFGQSVTPSDHRQTTSGQSVTQYTLPPDKLAKAKTLYTTQVVLLIVETIYGFIVLLFVVRGRLGTTFRNWAEAVSRFRFV
jgi:hypothetical protein